MNKKTTALTKEQYTEIITTMKAGGAGFRPNQQPLCWKATLACGSAILLGFASLILSVTAAATVWQSQNRKQGNSESSPFPL